MEMKNVKYLPWEPIWIQKTAHIFNIGYLFNPITINMWYTQHTHSSWKSRSKFRMAEFLFNAFMRKIEENEEKSNWHFPHSYTTGQSNWSMESFYAFQSHFHVKFDYSFGLRLIVFPLLSSKYPLDESMNFILGIHEWVFHEKIFTIFK